MRLISIVWMLLLAGLFHVPVSAQVRSGADVLLADSIHLLQGKRVGLLANHTSRLSSGVLLFDTLRALQGITMAAVYSPEHGFSGTAADGEAVASGAVAGVPLFSLYGATRRPNPEMFAGIDVLVMDLQDIGARYYTYLSTMAMCLETAAETGVEIIVCDRPNPVGGVIMEGPIRTDSLRSFVGYLPLPVRHGLTVGEALRMAVGEGWLRDHVRPRVTVVACAGWRRTMYYDETGLPWVQPSPNIVSLDAAIAYAGTCLLEGSNVSEGRGTDTPFLLFGAPFIDADTLAAALNVRALPGVRFHPAQFVPSPRRGAPRPRFSGQQCKGARLEISDRAMFDSFRTGVEILSELRLRYGAFLSFTSYLDLLAGIADMTNQPSDEIFRRSAEDVRRFSARRIPYLLYP
ncbi:MAG: DUF1343 domain-containing protein [Bacteroidetes bacterium]|nr:DUF1343 domain-containing protein [Bacteroidota bacterium]